MRKKMEPEVEHWKACLIIQTELQFGSEFPISTCEDSQCWLEKTDQLFRSLLATIAPNIAATDTDT